MPVILPECTLTFIIIFYYLKKSMTESFIDCIFDKSFKQSFLSGQHSLKGAHDLYEIADFTRLCIKKQIYVTQNFTILRPILK